MNPETRHTLSPLFGEIALDLGLVSAADLLDALCRQDEQRNRGDRADRIGSILVDAGSMTREQVAEVMREYDRRARTIEIPGFHSLELVRRDDTTIRFRGVALGTRRPVMIKVLRFSLAESPRDLESFARECRALARLDHGNLVKYLDSGDLEGVPYLVLEHVHGPDLRSLIDESGHLPATQALEITCAVAAGLAHAHSLGILHGALRPGAVLLPRLSGPKVTDFSLFDWDPEESDSKASRVTPPHYLSPEQARSSGRPTPRSDVYSLGATLFHMLTGRPPFRGSYRELLRQHLKRPAPDPRVHMPKLPESVAGFVLRMLEKNPADRPADMAEVIAEAERLASDRAVGVGVEATDEKRARLLPSRLMSRRAAPRQR